MSKRSVIEIDVRDGSFQRFQALFNKYQTALKDTPNKWREVGTAQSKLSSNFERQTAALMAQAQMAREKSKADDRQNKQLVQNDRLWTSMAHSTKAVAGNVVSATTALLRWTGILTGVTGLLGGGGLWGIDRMASTVASQRRQGMGLGMTPGEMQAFQINFGRFVDTDSFLEKINQARANPAEAWRLGTLGVSTAGSTSDVALRAMDAMRSRARATSEDQLGLLDSQTGMDMGVDFWRRQHDTSQSEYDDQRAHYQKDVGALSTNPDTNRSWTDTKSQFERAFATLFDSFQSRVGELAPEFTHLSDSLTGIGKKIIDSPFAQDAVTAVGHGLDWLGNKLDDPSFQARIEQFFSADGPVATAVQRFSNAVGNFSQEVQADLPIISRALHALAHPLDSDTPWASSLGGAADDLMHPYQNPDEVSRRESDVDVSKRINAAKRLGVDSRKFQQDQSLNNYWDVIRDTEAKYQLPPDLLRWQFAKESGSNLHPSDSSAGAVGPFQLEPIAIEQIKKLSGLTVNPRNPLDALAGGGIYDRYLMDKYGNDMTKAMAAYDLGEGKLDKILKQHPSDWVRYLPEETKNYVASSDSSVGGTAHGTINRVQPPGVTIRLDNQTGGSTTATVSALAQ